MYSKEVVIRNKLGLHSRPAVYFVKKVNDYKSAVWVEKDGRRINGKSLLGVLSLGIADGDVIKIIAEGVDEAIAAATLVEYLSKESLED